VVFIHRPAILASPDLKLAAFYIGGYQVQKNATPIYKNIIKSYSDKLNFSTGMQSSVMEGSKSRSCSKGKD